MAVESNDHVEIDSMKTLRGDVTGVGSVKTPRGDVAGAAVIGLTGDATNGLLGAVRVDSAGARTPSTQSKGTGSATPVAQWSGRKPVRA
jgi:hypothetical protein